MAAHGWHSSHWHDEIPLKPAMLIKPPGQYSHQGHGENPEDRAKH